MTWLADAQADGFVSGVWRDAGVQQAQPLERVGLQAREQGIHALDYLAIVFEPLPSDGGKLRKNNSIQRIKGVPRPEHAASRRG